MVGGLQLFLLLYFQKLKNHIKKQNKLNNAFLYFYSDKKIKENLKTNYPEEYKLIEDKIKLYETIKSF